MNLYDFENILIIAAHPDDEVLGAGGLIKKYTDLGKKVTVIFAATGISSRYSKEYLKNNDVQKEVDFLHETAYKANSHLGVKELFFLDFPDNRLDTVSRMDITIELKKYINKLRPDTVLTHHYGDYNWDHSIVYDSVLYACRANYNDHFPKILLAFEVLSSTERSFQNSQNIYKPNLFVDINNELEYKQKAMLEYKTELREYPHPRSKEAIKNLAAKRGNEVGLEFAEAFEIIRIIA